MYFFYSCVHILNLNLSHFIFIVKLNVNQLKIVILFTENVFSYFFKVWTNINDISFHSSNSVNMYCVYLYIRFRSLIFITYDLTQLFMYISVWKKTTSFYIILGSKFGIYEIVTLRDNGKCDKRSWVLLAKHYYCNYYYSAWITWLW